MTTMYEESCIRVWREARVLSTKHLILLELQDTGDLDRAGLPGPPQRRKQKRRMAHPGLNGFFRRVGVFWWRSPLALLECMLNLPFPCSSRSFIQARLLSGACAVLWVVAFWSSRSGSRPP